MALALGALTPAHAEVVAAWLARDAGILPSAAAASRLCDGEAAALLDDGELVGVLCVGTLAALDGGPSASDDATDVWLAVRPDRVGEGVATRAAELAIEALRVGGHTRLRTTLAASNVRGRRLALRAGFLPAAPRGDEPTGHEVLEREVLA